MATNDSQFAATGGENEDTFGFYTDPSQDDDGGPVQYGVNVQGLHCGVYAESLVISRPMGKRDTPNSQEQVGVYAIGQHQGVIGECLTGNGVIGKSPYSNGVGVYGINSNDREGVLGLCMHGGGTKLGIGSGVRGVSGTGSGVRGESRRTINPDQPLDGLQKVDGDGIGVQGVSGGGTGVNGQSTAGPGVRGDSEENRGGIFSSKNIAQLHLTPAHLKDDLTAVPLPSRAVAGDLFTRLVIINNNAPQDVPRQIQAELWFCVQPTEPSPTDTVVWRQVQFV